jgi:MauM/NapG family ferredoxin protein
MKPAIWCQILSFGLFFGLMLLSVHPVPPPVPPEAFLRLDPVAMLAAWLAGAMAWSALGPVFLLLVLTAVLGRFFCGWICPLGATIDAADRRVARDGGPASWEAWRPVKYQILAIVAAAALFGLSLAFLVAPVAVAMRFYALVIHSLLKAGAARVLSLIRPLALDADWTWVVYADPGVPHFGLPWFSAGAVVLILAAGRLAPRFWCRYLCPAGALLALAGSRPLWRRQVSPACIDCGLCQQACPTAAIGRDPRRTRFAECIVCQRCVRLCPTAAVRFVPNPAAPPRTPQASRRQVLASAAAGAALAWVDALDPRWPGARRPLPAGGAGLIRPPGAVPESDFLGRCVGCGLCLKVCPTNTLQPAGLAGGWAGLMSPRIVPRLGPCEPACNACGQVCPTGAIRPLAPEEKTWAKIGTAFVLRHKCLAFEFDQSCLVCDEVCPYDAIRLERMENRHVAVPLVDERRCSGCGLCHFHCPVRPASAIVVEPVGALRLAQGSYRRAARDAGLRLHLQRGPHAPPPASAPQAPEDRPPPGFDP